MGEPDDDRLFMERIANVTQELPGGEQAITGARADVGMARALHEYHMQEQTAALVDIRKILIQQTKATLALAKGLQSLQPQMAASEKTGAGRTPLDRVRNVVSPDGKALETSAEPQPTAV